MEKFWRFAPWLNRLVLLAATLIFALISAKYIADPVRTAATFKISLGSAAAITNMRVGFGAFPLGCAIITLVCLVSTSRLLTGLCFVATMIGVATAARVFGILVDGAATESLVVLRAEVILLTLSIIGLFIELGGRRYRLKDAA